MDKQILGFFIAAALVCLVYLVWRLRLVFQFKPERPRFFFGFWLWPLCFSLYENLLPSWSVPLWFFMGILGMMALAAGIDFFYYYGLKTNTAKKQQLLSLGLLVPCLLFSFRQELFEGTPAELVLPHSAQALVWTDELWQPKNIYFIRPNLTDSDLAAANYGRPVFSPIEGEVSALAEDGMWVLKNDEVTLAIGPFVPGSCKLQLGQHVMLNQPIGILDVKPGTQPGIHVQILNGVPVVLVDVISGRMLAFRQKHVSPQRNLLLSSVSATRFRME